MTLYEGPIFRVERRENRDEGESPLAAARRELAEETGLCGGDWTKVTELSTRRLTTTRSSKSSASHSVMCPS